MPKTWKIGNFCTEEKKKFQQIPTVFKKVHNSKFTHEHFLLK